MSDKQVPALTPGVLSGNSVLHFVDGAGDSRKTTLAALKSWINTNPTIVPSSVPHRGCLLKRTSTLSIANEDIISWQTAAYDTDAMWAAGSPTRITIGPDITKVKFFGGVQVATNSAAGSISLNLVKNGVVQDVAAVGRTVWRSGETGITANRNALWTPAIPVAENDYLELQFFANGLGGSPWTLSFDANVFFACEIVEAIAP
jgi:hypothetical protein